MRRKAILPLWYVSLVEVDPSATFGWQKIKPAPHSMYQSRRQRKVSQVNSLSDRVNRLNVCGIAC